MIRRIEPFFALTIAATTAFVIWSSWPAAPPRYECNAETMRALQRSEQQLKEAEIQFHQTWNIQPTEKQLAWMYSETPLRECRSVAGSNWLQRR